MAAAGGEDDLFESDPDTDSEDTETKGGVDKGKREHFFKELRCLLYGFGDDKVPYTETVELLEAMVIEYIQQMTVAALNVGKPGKVTLEDIWYLIRRDGKKYARVKDLLSMNDELKKARKAFDDTKY